jgi:hypothetical protein
VITVNGAVSGSQIKLESDGGCPSVAASATAGACIVTNGLSATGGDGVTLSVPSGAAIDILGAVTSYGPVCMGLLGASCASADVTPGTPAANAQVNLSNDIKTFGQPVVINGDVVLFNGLDFFTLEGMISSGKIGSDINPNPVTYRQPSMECDISEPCPFLPGFNPNLLLGLTKSTGPWTDRGPENTAIEDWSLNNCCAQGSAASLPNFVQTFANLQGGIVGVGTNGSVTVPSFAPGFFEIPSTAQQLADDNAVGTRVAGLNSLLTYATVTIDTTGGGNSGGATVLVNGNVSRYIPAQNGCSSCSGDSLPLYASHVNDELFVNLGMSGTLKVGGTLGDVGSAFGLSGIATFNGKAVDIEANTGNACVFTAINACTVHDVSNVADVPVGSGADPKNDGALVGATPPVPHEPPGYSSNDQLPLYGMFQLRLTGGPAGATLGSLLSVPTAPQGQNSGQLNSIIVNGTIQAPSPTAQETPGATPMQPATFDNGDLSGLKNNLQVVPRIYELDDPWTATSPTGPPSQTGPTVGTRPTVATVPFDLDFDLLPSVAEDPSRTSLQMAASRENEDTGAQTDQTDLCPRGVSRTADLGEQRSLQGAAPAVFVRCKSDFRK